MEGPELDRETITAGLLVIESRVAFQPPPAGSHELQGLDPEDAVELGEVLAGSHPGRSSADQITVYKSMGHAVEDAAAAALVLKQREPEAERHAVGDHQACSGAREAGAVSRVRP